MAEIDTAEGHPGSPAWGVDGAPPDMSLAGAVTAADLTDAADRLRGVAHRTPVLTSGRLDALAGARIFCKFESFQRIGAFKFRGAYNAMSRLDEGQRRRGVITFSSGNHAQAVALSAALLGVRTKVVMPIDAPAIKLAATRGYLADAPEGSEVIEFDPDEQVRERLGREIAEREGLVLIPPYDHPHVIAGQGTAALELFEEVGPLDELHVCLGGGGLLSGSAIAARALSPGCRVIGAEPELADDGARSFRDGVLRTVQNPRTIADGARTPYLGRYTLAMILERVDEIRTVSEAELAWAMRFVMQTMKAVVEPSGVLGLAGLLQERPGGRDPERRVGVVISGGNIDPEAIAGVLELAGGGRD